MQPIKQSLALLSISLIIVSASGKIITVNTTNNVSPGPGQTNLVQAINLLQDGDTIRFNIPGTGPFYLATPPLTPDNGYPAITNHNVTIDGYSQPGATPNTNPILAANNAAIKIVLDSRGGGRRVEDIAGYSSSEAAVLLIKSATNVTLSGLCFLGPGVGGGSDADPDNYAVSYALNAHAGHISGCWFGVGPDRTNVFRFKDAVTAFDAGPSGQFINGTVLGVAKDAANAAAARAQFNIIVGEFISVIMEGENYRIAGNFFNVFPDGLTDYNINGTEPHDIEAMIEIGRRGNNFLLGTDGDGVNDAEERNIFGGVTEANDDQILEWYGGTRTNMVFAGNYFGMAVDGVTRFTNSMKVFGGFNSTTTARVGSDFDGVSDDLEGNVFAMNYPFDALFPTPAAPGPPVFADLDPGARASFRGNRFIGNNIPPFSYATGFQNRVDAFTNYYAPFLVTDQIIPTLGTNANQSRLKGTCALGVAPYTNIVIDLYLADEEGWTNGQRFQLAELMYVDPITSQTKYYGFAQGRTYLGSFRDNGPEDLDPTPGQFDFNISLLNLPTNALITVAANYSSDPAGTHNGRTHTSVFAMPILLQPAPRLAAAKSGANVILSWPTNLGLFTIQSSPLVSPASWANVSPQPPITVVGANYQASVAITAARAFYRLVR